MLIFDFDGVLIDSIDEVAITAYNAVTDRLVTSLNDMPPDLLDLFKKNRYLVQPAGDQILLMAWCLENFAAGAQKPLSVDTYRHIIAQDRSPLADRTARFYARRYQFMALDRQRWFALHRPFQPLWEALSQGHADRIIILTLKDRDSLMRLCRHFGINVPGRNIYSGDGGATKIRNLHEIHARFQNSRYDFIEDSLSNLEELETSFKGTDVHLFPILADWGYVGPESIPQARTRGYRVFDQNDLIAFIEKTLP